MEKHKLLIRLLEWGRGETGGSLLVPEREDHNRCCVGILCRSLGIPDEAMEHIGTVDEMYESDENDDGEILEPVELPERLHATRKVKGTTVDSILTRLYEINDSKETTDEYKQAEIKRYMESLDVEVEFVNDED